MSEKQHQTPNHPVVRAKFLVATVTQTAGTVWEKGEKGMKTHAPGPLFEITMHPVYANGTEENDSFFAATPSGTLQISQVRKEVAAHLTPGTEFYIDFTPAS